MDSGIYCIFNKSNGKIYVGQSVQLKTRISQHKSELNFNNHSNNHLQYAWNKYGEDSFEFIVIETCDEEKLNDNEIKWINYFNSTNPDYGYNLESGGNSNYHLSDETKQKISEHRKGKCVGEDNPFYGKTHTEEVRKKISETQLGRKHSNETKNKMSESHIGLNSGEKHYNYGKYLSLDVKTKLSEIHNTSGYFRVYVRKCKKCKHGFYYTYRYPNKDGERDTISRVDINELKDAVLSKDLEWFEINSGVNIIDQTVV
jgi:group I intron endonuclease